MQELRTTELSVNQFCSVEVYGKLPLRLTSSFAWNEKLRIAFMNATALHMQNLWTCLQHMTSESGISWECEICCIGSCNCSVHALGSSGASWASWLYTLHTESFNWYAEEPNSQGASVGCLQSLLCACSLQTWTQGVFKVLRVQSRLFAFPWGRGCILC